MMTCAGKSAFHRVENNVQVTPPIGEKDQAAKDAVEFAWNVQGYTNEYKRIYPVRGWQGRSHHGLVRRVGRRPL
jgi:hypothetical protein